MKKIDLFTNRYPISKTLRFSLIPIGKTEENFNNALFLENDRERSQEYIKAKKLIDRYHKHFIEQVLSNVILDEIQPYADLYFKFGKTDKEIAEMETLENKMRKTISKSFSSAEGFSALFGQDIIKKILPEFLTDDEELKTINMFHDFTTYFSGFHENRKNIYTDEPQSTASAYRCINENLPKFLDNVAAFKKISENLTDDIITRLDTECTKITDVYLNNIFNVDYFNMVLSQSGIDRYNSIIGGYVDNNGTKIQGINECINLYNQQIAKNDKSKKLPFLKMLYKQILSDRESISFLPESFENDNEVIEAIKSFFKNGINEKCEELKNTIQNLDEYNPSGIYVKSGASITDISNAVYGDWSAISRGWNEEYEKNHPLKSTKQAEKYYETREKVYKNISSFSIAVLQHYGDISTPEEMSHSIIAHLKGNINEQVNIILKNYESAQELLNENYSENNNIKLAKNEMAIKTIKDLLDSVKNLERTLKPLLGTGKESGKDDIFYSDFIPIYEYFSSIDSLYDKVRNYITKKPYSKNKIKLNFENPQLLGGWDKNKEPDYRTVILRKDNKYYLAIMNKGNSRIFINPPECTELDCYEKMEYKLLPGPNKMLPKVFFAKSNLEYFNPSKEILGIRKKESFKKGADFSLGDCHKFINFFKDSISKHSDWSQFGFSFSPTESYKDISEFYNEVKTQGYTLKFKPISEQFINELIDNGQLYLFQIYNKDFSEYSHGKPNLHTMYFKMLFDEENLKNVVYQLNGSAEMFYRDASIKESEKIIHPANQPIQNKNEDNAKRESTFKYDLIKDKRYTKRQFSLHLPITLNFKAGGQTYINNEVRKALKDCEDNYVIGIDRGERNLLYICVINQHGKIVEQKSLNEIVASNNYKVNYHKLLDKKEKERDNARKNWGTVENIKELKEGYLSQVVNEICKLVLKYDAIISMEDLNFGFKKGRFKVEKQVYQKFENMLITKLNFLVQKDYKSTEIGGLLNAYQLTNKVEGVNRVKQNGFIFYVPAWLTSKIDPVTGFTDLLKPKYTSIPSALEFIKKFDDVRYNANEDLFEFDINLSLYPGAYASYRKKWTICTYGDRIINFRNPEKNNSWDCKTIIMTNEFKSLFDKHNIDYKNVDIKKALLNNETKEFLEEFIKLFSRVLQMRNSETGNVDIDYLISPVRNNDGIFYDSRYVNDKSLPENADANGAYNIARKALWAISVLKETEDDLLKNASLTIKNADWLEYAQK